VAAGLLHVATRVAGSADLLLARLPWRCPLHFFTGLECPTCGLGRALCAAAMGDLGTAWRYHPVGIALALALPVVFCTGRVAPRIHDRMRALAARRDALVVAVALYTLWGVWRAA